MTSVDLPLMCPDCLVAHSKTKDEKDHSKKEEKEKPQGQWIVYKRKHKNSPKRCVYLPNDYSLGKVLGEGTYGTVYEYGKSSQSQKLMIIKIIHNIFESDRDFYLVLTEVRFLKWCQHPNIVKLIRVEPPPPKLQEWNHIVLVMNQYESDLFKIIASQQILTLHHIAYIFAQLALAVQYAHKCNVFHRDIKPSNILINGDCTVALGDWGTAGCERTYLNHKTQSRTKRGFWTGHVTSRWYAAPETLDTSNDSTQSYNYTKAIDIWSLGCVLGEMMKCHCVQFRTPLFCGHNQTHQMQTILNAIGCDEKTSIHSFCSTSNMVKTVTEWKTMHQNDNQAIQSCFRLLFIREDGKQDIEQAYDLLMKMLQPDPTKRITIDEMVKHSFLVTYVNEFQEKYETQSLQTPKPFELIYNASPATYRETMKAETC